MRAHVLRARLHLQADLSVAVGRFEGDAPKPSTDRIDIHACVEQVDRGAVAHSEFGSSGAPFPIHHVVAWCCADADVQARLAWLATRLGHAGLAGAQAYLAMTPELLTEASLRFQRYSALGGLGGAS